MRRRMLLGGVGVAALVVFVAAAGTYFMRAGWSWPLSQVTLPAVRVVCPGQTYTTNGVPLIQPRNDCTPSFSERDVRAWVSQHGAPLGRIQAVGTPTVAAVYFTTVGDLSRVSGDDEFAANYPARMVVCVVQFTGTFFGGGLLGTTQPTAGKAFLLLDAHTGNELVEGSGWPVK